MSFVDTIRASLNEQQATAALHTSTSSLIIAGAGSGKTRTLTYKIAYLIIEQGVDPRQILAVTFTNKAAKEMKERIIELIEHYQSHSPAGGVQASPSPTADTGMLDFDDLIADVQHEAPQHTMASINVRSYETFKWMGTFHSSFLKMLRDDIETLKMGYTKSFGVYDAGEAFTLIKNVVKQLRIADHLDPKEAARAISRLKNQGVLPARARQQCQDERDEYVASVYEVYQKELVKANSVDFDDLLLLPYTLFVAYDDVLQKWRTQFRYVMVDEAQDTNWIQFEIMKLLTQQGGNVTFIGDDFQSIYRRRGAMMDNFLNVDRRRPDIQSFLLEINYRSRPHIVDAGNAIISSNTKQYKKDVRAHREGDDTVKICSFGDETDEAVQIVELIKKIKHDKDHKRGDFAILYRTNAQSQPFEAVLVTEGLPYKIWGGFKFFDRKEIKDTISYLKYLANPKDNIALKRIINVPSRKIGATTISRVEEYALEHDASLTDVLTQIESLPVGLGKAAVTSIKKFVTTMKFVEASMQTASLSKVISQLLSMIQYKEYLINLEGKEKAAERFDNIGQLVNMTAKYEGDGSTPASEMIGDFLEEISLMSELETNNEGDLDAIKLMSIHTSKGLEFDVVFVVGCEENLFPLGKAKFDTDEMEEERRLMYVAITRAENRLFLSHTNSRFVRGQQRYNTPSRFLEELPDELVKKYDFGGGSGGGGSVVQYAEGDRIFHKLFGQGTIMELWGDTAMIKFANPTFGMRKLDVRFVEKV